MMFFRARKLFVLFLAAFVTLGLSLSSIPAGAMVDMTMSGKMDMADQPDCPHCKDKADAAKAMVCGSVCVASVMAVLPAASNLGADLDAVTSFRPLMLPHGRSFPPDPYPPRPTFIG